MKKLITKVLLGLFLFAVMVGSSFGDLSSNTAQAHYGYRYANSSYNNSNNIGNLNYNNDYYNNSYNGNENNGARYTNGRTNMIVGQNFYQNNRDRFWNRRFVRNTSPQRVIFVDQTNNNQLSLYNTQNQRNNNNLNTVVVLVDHAFYDRLNNLLNTNQGTNQPYTVTANTTNNMVTFSNMNGRTATASASISVQ